MQSTFLTSYQEMIQEFTNAAVHELPILENIMRDEIFHSTLDWQSRAQFRTGAKKALKLFQEDRAFYLADARLKRAAFEASVAEQQVTRISQSEDSQAITLAKKQREIALAELALAEIEFNKAK
jgi:hypothetical protein